MKTKVSVLVSKSVKKEEGWYNGIINKTARAINSSDEN